MRTALLATLLLAVACQAVITPGPATEDAALVAIQVRTRSPAGQRTGYPGEVYFVRLDEGSKDPTHGAVVLKSNLARGGFIGLESFSYDVEQPYSHEAWRGRVRASAGIGASLAPEEVTAFDAEHAALLAANFPADPLTVLHRVFAVIARRP